FGSIDLPRPRTGDAVFFDLPLLGLVIYPESWSIVLAVLVCVIAGAVAFRVRTGVVAGVLVSIIAVLSSAAVAWRLAAIIGAIQARLPWGGNPSWRGTSALAVSLAVIAIVLALVSLTRRWTWQRGARAGALIVWALIGLLAAVRAPGASYLFI